MNNLLCKEAKKIYKKKTFTTKKYSDAIADLQSKHIIVLNYNNWRFSGLSKEFLKDFKTELENCGINLFSKMSDPASYMYIAETFDFRASVLTSIKESKKYDSNDINTQWRKEQCLNSKDYGKVIEPIPYMFMIFVNSFKK